MPLLEGRATSSEQGYQLECDQCEGRYYVYQERSKAVAEGRSLGWSIEGDRVECSACSTRKTRYEILSHVDS